MMYKEFLLGTGCKANSHNYKVFEDLEKMYQNSDLTKEQIYEYGKKLVDNSLSEEELAYKNYMEDTINKIKEDIAFEKNEIAKYESYLAIEENKECRNRWKDCIHTKKALIRKLKEDIKIRQEILTHF